MYKIIIIITISSSVVFWYYFPDMIKAYYTYSNGQWNVIFFLSSAFINGFWAFLIFRFNLAGFIIIIILTLENLHLVRLHNDHSILVPKLLYVYRGLRFFFFFLRVGGQLFSWIFLRHPVCRKWRTYISFNSFLFCKILVSFGESFFSLFFV